MPGRGSGSTTRWARSSSPTSSVSMSVSASCASSTTASAASISGRRTCSSSSSMRATSARRPGRASTPTRASRPRVEGVTGGLAGGLTEEERLLQATAREFATRELAPTAIERDEAERYDRSLFTKMGELGLTAAPLPEVGRRGRVLVPRLDAGHGGARRGRHVDGGLALGPHPVAVPGRHLGDARAARPLAATDARRRGARRLRADGAARRAATPPRSERAPSASGRPTRRPPIG